MTASVGREITLIWGSDSPPEGIAGVKQKDLSISGEAIDVTTGDDAGWRTLLSVPGQKHVELKVSGVAQDHKLLADWFAGNLTQAVTLTYEDGATLTGNFFLSEYGDKGAFKDAVTFDATLMSTGVITYTPAGSPA
jgi:predicted secreted protein